MQDDLDLPVFVTADQIRRREFVASRRGYDAEQVKAFLEQIATQIEQMEQMLKEARLKAEAAATAPVRDDPYEAVSRRVAETMRTADEAANRIIAEARLEAEQILVPARTEADRVRLEAKKAAESALSAADAAIHEARERAEKVLARIGERRERALMHLQQFRDQLTNAATTIEQSLKLRDDDPLAATDDPVLTAPIPTITPEPEPAPPLDASAVDPTYADLFGGTPTTPAPAVVTDGGVEDLDIPEIPRFDVSWEALDEGAAPASTPSSEASGSPTNGGRRKKKA